MKKNILLISLVLVGMSGCLLEPDMTINTPSHMEEVRLPVGYIPNVQFSPIYVAMEKGYFEEENINLILDYSFETDAVTLLGADEIKFAIASGEQILLARAQEIPVVYVMAWYQKYPVAVASKAGNGLLEPDHLRGRSIGLPVLSGASYIGLRTILQAGGISEQDVSLEVIGFNQVEMLATDQVDAVVIYVANEPVVLQSQGYPTDLIRVDDYLTLVSNGLITNEKTLKEDPEMVKSMVRALLHGIRDTIANPDEAYQISLRYVETLAQSDENVQKRVLMRSIELWQGPTLGFSDPNAWENMSSILKSMDLLKGDVDLSKAFTNDFLP
ncbi:MAG: ABC transporter substrate-binding protein [Anaerolineaceae bacterium]|nr:ABC transporter substrate-binding protein [Anaerolineaceae bacterium]MBN2677371.1 ABC transporter substrate-binding protein [Anaerolineaceae bacterium]